MIEPKFTYDELPPDKDLGPTVLILDDDSGSRNRMADLCEKSGMKNLRVLFAKDILEAKSVLALQKPIHVLLLDKDLGIFPDGRKQNGIKVIKEFLDEQPHLIILVVTSSTETSDIVEAIKLGAFDYIDKGQPSEAITHKIKTSIEVARLKLKINQFEGGMEVFSEVNLAGSSVAMQNYRSRLQAAALSDEPVLLIGESGTGKTEGAKAIHLIRQRHLKQEGAFFAFNARAISENIAESQLFGHERGSFTGATETKLGYFELAHGGTIFLDEIGEATESIQTKLLKAVDEGKVLRVGGKKDRPFKAKIVCATNRDLLGMVETGAFRKDLYYRINILEIKVPSLDERKEDIPEIVRAILPTLKNRVPFEDLPHEFIRFLETTQLPGGVRQIRKYLSQLITFAPKDEKSGRPVLRTWKKILNIPVHPDVAVEANSPISYRELKSRDFDLVGDASFPGLKAIENLIFEKLMRDASRKFKNISEIAQALGLLQQTLYTKLRRMPEFKKFFSIGKNSERKSLTSAPKVVVGEISQMRRVNG